MVAPHTREIVLRNKRTKDAVKRMENPEHTPVRDELTSVPPEMMSPAAELEALRYIYMATPAPQHKPALCKGIELVRKEIVSKHRGYAAQDKKKGIFSIADIITPDLCTGKLIACNLKCWYCKKGTTILYREVRQPDQWTLDRLDNDLGHTDENTVIACLECNLKRRRQSADKYKLGKSIIVKR